MYNPVIGIALVYRKTDIKQVFFFKCQRLAMSILKMIINSLSDKNRTG